ncbi:nucleotidyl transferase AbiEii/AbiGii toxin family protein [Variovorax sp. UC74_104]|uniref:nucleotidyl transferase AbiEii/AbiGii toxin family protein n=1 Tax=Variovorax sp. UC74_104 TaxID=3374555 RepID=UPI003757927C
MTLPVTQAGIENEARRTGATVEQARELVLLEGFMRRAAWVGGPFMLKGSLVTRQYLSGPGQDNERLSRDIDWVCTEPFDRERSARQLNTWAQSVTTVHLDDGLHFRPFIDNAFWRMIDYAMDDDFPTVSTDIDGCVLDGDSQTPLHRFRLDVSFNLKLDPPPVPLHYRPCLGEAFHLPSTCALDLQIAWKLHQCLVRPRFKDLLDLMWLVPHNAVDADAVGRALRTECAQDKADIGRLRYLLNGDMPRHPRVSRPARREDDGTGLGVLAPRTHGQQDGAMAGLGPYRRAGQRLRVAR